MREVDPGSELEQFCRQMGACSYSARPVVEFSGPGFCQRDEFGQRFDRKIRIHDQQRGRGCHHRYALEFLQGVIRQLVLEKAGIDHERRIRCKQCITVGRRTANGAGADHRRSTRPIVDDDGRVQDIAGFGRYNSKRDIGTAAGGVGYDDADRVIGIVLCRYGGRRYRDQRDIGEPRQKRPEIHRNFPALDGCDEFTDCCSCNQPASLLGLRRIERTCPVVLVEINPRVDRVSFRLSGNISRWRQQAQSGAGSAG